MASEAIGIWLAATKFHAPARRHDVLSRPRLIDALKTSLATFPLTLISAPAGAGKTSLLAELPHALPDMRWAWLLLDEDDNDPIRFIAALVGALEIQDPQLGEGVLGAMGVSGSNERLAVTTFINNVARSGEPLALVIDDLHVITDAAVHKAIDYLINRLPPNMRVVMGTRHDPPLPLAKWRARGDLAEFRLEDLSFTEEETGQLLNERLALGLTPEEVRTLYARAEGWAAGLRLLATSMAHTPRERRAPLHQGMRGSRRVFDFLMAEVLDRQPTDIRRFLLDTSILSSLTAPLCDALTGRTDSHFVLEDLYRRSLYVVAADESGTAYRYHDLFADFLSEQLKRERPTDWKKLNEKAAALATSQGRRLRHLISGESWEAAAAEIEKVGPHYASRGYTTSLRRWIEDLPDDVRQAHPRLCFLLGHASWVQNGFTVAQPYLEQALEGFRRLNDPIGQSEALVALANTAITTNQFERSRALIEEALTLELPASGRIQLHAAAGWDAIFHEDWDALQVHLEQVWKFMSACEDSSNPLALQLVMFCTGLPGGLENLELVCRRRQELLTGNPSIHHAMTDTFLTGCHLLRGDIDQADVCSERGLATARELGQAVIVNTALAVSLFLSAMCRGEFLKIERTALAAIESYRETHVLRNWKPLFTYFLARGRWLSGNTAGVEECYRQMCEPVDARETQPARVFRTLVKGIYHLTERSYAQAEQVFRQALVEEKAVRVSRALSNASTMLSYTLLKRGKSDEAYEIFGPILAEVERRRIPGELMRENPISIPLLRLAHERGYRKAYVEELLSRMGATLEEEEPAGQEILSERELEVLKVMAEGIGNREIGERLFVSEATVKTHVQRIMRKLDASSRTHAVARARELALI